MITLDNLFDIMILLLSIVNVCTLAYVLHQLYIIKVRMKDTYVDIINTLEITEMIIKLIDN